MTVAAPGGNIPKFLSEVPYSPFYFGVGAFFLYVAGIFAWLFLRNAYQRKRRAVLHDFLRSLTDPIESPELIDDEYLVHVLESFRMLWEKKDEPTSRSEYEKLRSPIRTAMAIRQGNRWESAVAMAKLGRILVEDWSWHIVLTAIYLAALPLAFQILALRKILENHA